MLSSFKIVAVVHLLVDAHHVSKVKRFRRRNLALRVGFHQKPFPRARNLGDAPRFPARNAGVASKISAEE